MKPPYSLLFFLLLAPVTWAGRNISIQQFEQITDPNQRGKMIEQAPPNQKDELKKIDRHMRIVAAFFGGEAGFRANKESAIAQARGFTQLEDVFTTQTEIWDDNMRGVHNAYSKSGMTQEQVRKAWASVHASRETIDQRLTAVYSLVYRLAKTSQALELEKNAEILNQDMKRRLAPEVSQNRVTNEQRLGFDKRVDEIYKTLQRLPKLSPEQVQREYDAFPDEQVRPPQLI